MNVKPQIIKIYTSSNGSSPYEEWLEGLRDIRARAKIRVRIDQLTLGNFGRCRFLNEGLGELKIDWGPGYRVYFGQNGLTLVLLLCGGDKSSQDKDLKKAKELWIDYRRRYGKKS